MSTERPEILFLQPLPEGWRVAYWDFFGKRREGVQMYGVRGVSVFVGPSGSPCMGYFVDHGGTFCPILAAVHGGHGHPYHILAPGQPVPSEDQLKSEYYRWHEALLEDCRASEVAATAAEE